jgi:hypothetical protein
VSHDETLFEWMGDEHVHCLNGSSHFRSAEPIKFLQPGDGVVGRVVSIARQTNPFAFTWPNGTPTPRTVIRVEHARIDGEDIEPGTWVEFWWAPADLRRAWELVGGVNVGDLVRVGFLGRDDPKSGNTRTAKLRFAASVERAEEAW